MERKEKKAVLIVGAGIAGLAAAEVFQLDAVTDWCILEARDRIGGRVGSVEFANCSFPTGAAFLHGVKGNPMSEIARELKLPSFPDFTDDEYEHAPIICRDMQGEDCTKDFRQAYGKIMIVLNDLSEMHTELNKIPLQSEQISEISKDTDLAQSLKEFGWYGEPNFQTEKLVECLLLNISSGISAKHLSTKAYLVSEEMYVKDDASRNHYLLEGDAFKRCAEAIASKAKVKEGVNLHFDSVVETVNFEDETWIKVTLKDGRIFECKYLIMTIPAKVMLKSVKFQPDLPINFVQALGNIDYCDYQRVFVEFESVFWDDVAVILRSDEQDQETLFYWQNAYFLFQQMQVVADQAPKVLIGHASGEAAKRVREMSKEDLHKLIAQGFSAMYPDQKDNIVVKDSLVISWADDPYAGGAFAYARPPINGETVRALQMPAGGGRIRFAGDAYDINYIGSSQCAYITGQKAADNISYELKHYFNNPTW